MRPYLEVEVVKVSKPKEKVFRCKACGTILPAEKPKSNWVNGENLNEIKFPCFCRFDANKGIHGEIGKTNKVEGIGILSKNYYEGKEQYELLRADCQFGTNDSLTSLSAIRGVPSLKTLIEIYDIHILKGKIILFEEE